MSPREVQASFTADPTATYVDVRTVAEFAAAHPKGNVVNVPIGFFDPSSKKVFPNESFLQVMEELYPKDARLITGCDGGQRARQAAGQLLGAGYTNISMMPEGFAGWRGHELPTTRDNRSGISYVSLLTRVKRNAKKK